MYVTKVIIFYQARWEPYSPVDPPSDDDDDDDNDDDDDDDDDDYDDDDDLASQYLHCLWTDLAKILNPA